MAPEQVLGRPVDARADVYSLGVLLFELLARVTPFRRDSLQAVFFAHLNDPVPPVSRTSDEVPAAFNEVIQRALAKMPSQRYQSAGELAQAARAALTTPTAHAAATSKASPAPQLPSHGLRLPAV